MRESEIDARFEERAAAVRTAVAAAARRGGRAPDAVQIVAVTKGFPAPVIGRVAAAGFTAIGENRIGEAEAKRTELGAGVPEGVTWRMVGHLQRNKAARAVVLFDAIDSVDSLRLARRLDEVAIEAGVPDLPVLVQVNASGEATKGGFTPEEAIAAVGDLVELSAMRVSGLMTMAPFGASEAELRRVFARTRACLEDCRERSARVGSELSMGMSGDFEIAVEEGATQVRLGTALLGERPR